MSEQQLRTMLETSAEQIPAGSAPMTWIQALARRRRRTRLVRATAGGVAAVALLAAGAWGATTWTVQENSDTAVDAGDRVDDTNGVASTDPNPSPPLSCQETVTAAPGYDDGAKGNPDLAAAAMGAVPGGGSANVVSQSTGVADVDIVRGGEVIGQVKLFNQGNGWLINTATYCT